MSEEVLPATSPRDYARLLSECSLNGELPLVVGGQGVNVWALYFEDEEQGLEALGPFTSGDCDVVAGQDWLRAVAERTGLKYKIYKAGVASPEVGMLVVPLPTGETMIQVLRNVKGVHIDQVIDEALFVKLDEDTYRVMHPIVLLQAKLANVLELPQKNRQDIKHVKILCYCVRAFLRTQIDELMKGDLDARECIGFMEWTAEVITSENAHKVAMEHGLSFSNIFPVESLPINAPQALVNFAEKRVPRLNIAADPDAEPIVSSSRSSNVISPESASLPAQGQVL